MYLYIAHGGVRVRCSLVGETYIVNTSEFFSYPQRPYRMPWQPPIFVAWNSLGRNLGRTTTNWTPSGHRAQAIPSGSRRAWTSTRCSRVPCARRSTRWSTCGWVAINRGARATGKTYIGARIEIIVCTELALEREGKLDIVIAGDPRRCVSPMKCSVQPISLWKSCPSS